MLLEMEWKVKAGSRLGRTVCHITRSLLSSVIGPNELRAHSVQFSLTLDHQRFQLTRPLRRLVTTQVPVVVRRRATMNSCCSEATKFLGNTCLQ